MKHTTTSVRRGSSLVWTTIVLVALMGFVSLAVDWGRVQLVKGELRVAADGAARHAAQTFLTTGNVSATRTAAVSAAHDNKADGPNRVVLDPNLDVRFGSWNVATKAFVPAAAGGELTATAIEVTARRTQNRGNPVSLTFARVIGRNSISVRARAVARINSRRPGIVGLDYISTSGSSGVGNVTNSFRSKAGAFSSSTTTYGRGTIMSNGYISLSGNTTINGDARPGIGQSVTTAGSASVTGSRTPLTKALDYPLPTPGTAATTNNNGSIPSSYTSDRDLTLSTSLTLPGGTYYLDDVTITAVGTLNFSGPATLYLTGNLDMRGSINTSGANPNNLKVIGLGYHTMDFTSSSHSYMDVYAPGYQFRMGGSSTLCGSVIAKSVTMGGNASVIFDESLTVSVPAVSLVQ